MLVKPYYDVPCELIVGCVLYFADSINVNEEYTQQYNLLGTSNCILFFVQLPSFTNHLTLII